jgi:hypothetical protein
VNGVFDDGEPSSPRVNVAAKLNPPVRIPEPPARRHGPARGEVRPPSDEPSLGELKAQHRELHLCLRCTHHMVCGMAKALDPNLLVTIATCLAFEPDDADGANRICELLPVEPLPST